MSLARFRFAKLIPKLELRLSETEGSVTLELLDETKVVERYVLLLFLRPAILGNLNILIHE